MHTGSCLCEGVQFEVDGELSPILLCHCGRCRKSGGSAFNSVLLARAAEFRWVKGQELATEYTQPLRDTPPPYTRRFCSRCGSPLPLSREMQGQEWVAIWAGTLDGDPKTRPNRHIFVSKKAPWFEICDELPQFPEHVPPDQRVPQNL